MPHSLAQTRVFSRRNPLGRYAPKRISEHTRWRFLRDRRTALIRRIGGGPPTERQALAIDMMVATEWSVVVAEHDAEATTDPRTRTDAMRVAADARKQVLLWDRALTAAMPPIVPTESPDPLAALHQHLAERQRQAAP
jgi:hypothetical protein